MRPRSGEDRHEPGLIEQALLEVPEEECAVSHERPAKACAVLLLVHWQRGARERIGRVETVVADEVVHRSSKCVRAALGHDVDVAAKGASEFCLSA